MITKNGWIEVLNWLYEDRDFFLLQCFRLGPLKYSKEATELMEKIFVKCCDIYPEYFPRFRKEDLKNRMNKQHFTEIYYLAENLGLDSSIIDRKFCSCGNIVAYNHHGYYQPSCSIKCGENLEQTKQKRSITIAQKASEDADYWKKRLEKAANTNLEKYGNSNYYQSEHYKKQLPEIRKHWTQTFLSKYGVEHCSQLPDFTEKLFETKKNNGSLNCYQSLGELEWLKSLGISQTNQQVWVKPYLVDGLKNGIVYEFLGDLYHGHPKLKEKRKISEKLIAYVGMTMEEAFKKTEERFKSLNAMGYGVIYCWESDFKKDRKFKRVFSGKLEWD